MGGCAGKKKSNANEKAKDYSELPVEKDSTADIQTPSDQYDGINQVISQIFSSRVIPMSDLESEYELANLVYGHPEYDYVETPPIVPKFQSSDV